MSRVLVAGDWAGGEPTSPRVLHALEQVGAGFRSARPTWEVDLLPFGPGPTFREALTLATARSYVPVSVGQEETSTHRAGYEARRIFDSGLVPVVEGGHLKKPDAGLGFLSAFTGIDLEGVREGTHGSADRLLHAITQGKCILQGQGRTLIAAASTTRPLLGLNSVLALTPDLETRPHQDRAFMAVLTKALATRPRMGLPVIGGEPPRDDLGPGRMSGSGAAGGAAAMISAMGGQIWESGDVLSASYPIDPRLEGADLVIVLEPSLHSPHLAQSPVTTIAEHAGRFALPLVALGVDSSLSGHERAEWGFHGQFLTHGTIPLAEAGRRIARTWTR